MTKEDELSNEEKIVFEKEFYDFIHSNYPEKIHEIIKDYRHVIIQSVIITKHILRSNFCGVFPSAGEFGWSFPHPLFFFSDKDTWINKYKKGLWTTWIDKILHSSSSTFLLFGFYELSKAQCNISSIYIESDGITYPPLWIKNSINESRVYYLPIPVFSKSALRIKVLSESDCTCELIPFGIYFGSRLYDICYRQSQPKTEKRA
ncbi:MAG: hypothetical protein KKD99_13695 [Proteobacteria bacterium]|nr:hypothetical protein [Pseudomonadota bacterium]